MEKKYIKPEYELVDVNTEDIMSASGATPSQGASSKESFDIEDILGI